MPTTLNDIIRVPKTAPLSNLQEVYSGNFQHPLEIETEDWHLIWIASVRIPVQNFLTDDGVKEFLEEIIRTDPKINWAVRQSFDGAYIRRVDTYPGSNWEPYFKIGVYLKGQQATFWKLKHGS